MPVAITRLGIFLYSRSNTAATPLKTMSSISAIICISFLSKSVPVNSDSIGIIKNTIIGISWKIAIGSKIVFVTFPALSLTASTWVS